MEKPVTRIPGKLNRAKFSDAFVCGAAVAEQHFDDGIDPGCAFQVVDRNGIHRIREKLLRPFVRGIRAGHPLPLAVWAPWVLTEDVSGLKFTVCIRRCGHQHPHCQDEKDQDVTPIEAQN